jgi:hypothetical protein
MLAPVVTATSIGDTPAALQSEPPRIHSERGAGR